MTVAKCFHCKKELKINKSLESLIEAKLPLFCSIDCSAQFPDNGTKEFDEELKRMKKAIL